MTTVAEAERVVITDQELVDKTRKPERRYSFSKMTQVGPYPDQQYKEVQLYYVEFVYSGKKRERVDFPDEASQNRALDAYYSLHPYPGNEVCWYCWKQPGESAVFRRIKLYRIAGTSHVGNATITTYTVKSVHIPRCKKCQDYHKRASRDDMIAGLLGILCIVLFIGSLLLLPPDLLSKMPAWVKWHYPAVPVAGMVISLAIFVYAIVKSVRVVPLGHLNSSNGGHVLMYPPVRGFWQYGYRLKK